MGGLGLVANDADVVQLHDGGRMGDGVDAIVRIVVEGRDGGGEQVACEIAGCKIRMMADWSLNPESAGPESPWIVDRP